MKNMFSAQERVVSTVSEQISDFVTLCGTNSLLVILGLLFL